MMNDVIKKYSDGLIENDALARGAAQPPTFPCRSAASGRSGPPFPDDDFRLPVLLLAAALALALAGCKTPVSASGSYSVPGRTVSGTVQTTTNSLTLGGSYQTGTTNVTGTISVGK